jgi:hypothetical protein
VGLLAGNANIVRLPSKKNIQAEMICNEIKRMFDNGEYPEMKSRICLIRYAHPSILTDDLSAICDTRIIWGGDQTISEIRKSMLPPRATEILFADRYSVAVIDADCYLRSENHRKTAIDFYNDTYLTDQNACTSPRIVIWLGNSVEKAKSVFWEHLEKIVREKYSIQPIQIISKLTDFYEAAAERPTKLVADEDFLIMRVNVNLITDNLFLHFGNSGLFYEYSAGDLCEILPLANNKLQTVSYYGVDPNDIFDVIMSNCSAGVDRIVPIGRTMDFARVWDGYDLISCMSRIVSVE